MCYDFKVKVFCGELQRNIKQFRKFVSLFNQKSNKMKKLKTGIAVFTALVKCAVLDREISISYYDEDGQFRAGTSIRRDSLLWSIRIGHIQEMLADDQQISWRLWHN